MGEPRSHTVVRKPLTQARELVEGLPERLRELHLVEEEQRVVGQETCMHRLHALAHAIALHEHARSDLIHGRGDDERLVGSACPTVILGHPAAQRENAEWLFARPGQRAQSIGDLNDGGVGARHQRAQKRSPALGDLIDDDAPVHDHRDATRAPAILGFVVCVERQREEGDVDARGLAGAGREVEHPRPALVSDDLLEQALLPRKGLLATVNGGVEGAEVGGRERHRSPTGRQSPRPK